MQLRLLALSLFSGALFLVELGLTRLFAIRYYPPFVFLILAIAILGIGLGAALATGQPVWRQFAYLPRYVAGAALSTLLLLYLMTTGTGATLLLPLATLPFLWAGLLLATLFSTNAAASPRLYFADLLGAGSGALLVTPLFDWVGVWQGMVIAVALLAVAGVLFQIEVRRDRAMAAHRHGSTGDRPVHARGVTQLIALCLLALTSTIVMTAARRWQPAPHQLFSNKPIAQRLASGGEIIATTWDSFARTDLIAPAGDLPYELYMDGAAGSVMPPAAGHPALWRDIGFFPFATEQPERVFVIGPGGGLDLWFGLQSGAAEIVGVEVNPASVDLLERYAAYNGNLAGQDAIRLVVGEGRSVLAREGHFYDLIFLSQVVTLAAERTGYALVENSAYTVEAVADYLAHLRPAGMVAFKLYDELTLTRTLTTVLTVLERYGLSAAEAMAQIIILQDPSHDPPIPLLMVRNEPFTRNDALSLGAVANDVGFQPLFLPDVWVEAPFDAIVTGDISLQELIAAAPDDLRPTTDNRPFFFLFERGIPQALRPLLWAMGALLLIGIALLAIVPAPRAEPLERAAGVDRQWRKRRGFVFYFVMLGAGFMLVEITLMQQTQRFLGHPSTAVTVILATLLLGAGVGSGLAGRWIATRPIDHGLPQWPLIGILLSFALWLTLWPRLSDYFLRAEILWRIGLVVSYLLPLALFLGMPFVLGLRAVAKFGNSQVALAWAVNGVATVIGTLLAVTIALLWGYSAVALLAWLCYLGALIWTLLSPRLS